MTVFDVAEIGPIEITKYLRYLLAAGKNTCYMTLFLFVVDGQVGYAGVGGGEACTDI